METDDTSKSLIRDAMEGIEQETCVRFKDNKLHHEHDYIVIDHMEGRGCSSLLGRRGGNQSLNLHPEGCMVLKIIQHELIHALGNTLYEKLNVVFQIDFLIA